LTGINNVLGLSKPEQMQQTFGKEYRLASKREIEHLFAHKNTLRSYPLTMYFRYFDSECVHLKFVTSAPKRIYKHAHDRNRLKRLMREAIRKNKLSLTQFLDQNDLGLHVFTIYSADKEVPFENVEKSIKYLFKKIENEISTKTTH
jgi:ribonuclease P protein component